MQGEQDIIHLECPSCKEPFPVYCSKGPRKGNTYGIDTAPLICLAEIRDISREEGAVQCIHCYQDIAINVLFTAEVRPYTDQEFLTWRKE